MRKIRIVLLAGLLLGWTASAGAAPLNWSGTSTTQLGDFAPTEVFGGGVATVNGPGGLGHVQTLRLAGSRGGVSTDRLTRLVTDPDTVGNSIAAIVFSNVGGGSGTFAPISGAAESMGALTRNTLPVPGVVRICLVTTACDDFLDLVLTQQTENGATIGVGVGGLLTIGGDTPIKISLQAAPWTIKTGVAIDQVLTTAKVNTEFITKTLMGFAHDPSSGTTSTAQPSGVVQLVTPNQIVTNLPFGTSERIGGGITLRINFIPEPGLLMLLGSGVLGLALLGRSRTRRK